VLDQAAGHVAGTAQRAGLTPAQPVPLHAGRPEVLGGTDPVLADPQVPHRVMRGDGYRDHGPWCGRYDDAIAVADRGLLAR
jgi:hypothetical protein